MVVVSIGLCAIAQPQQVLSSSLTLFPLVPDAISQPVSYPTVYIPELTWYTCHTEVIQPAPLQCFQLDDSFRYTAWRGFAGDLPGFLFQVRPTFTAYHQLVFAFCTLFIGGYIAITQYGKLYRTPYMLSTSVLAGRYKLGHRINNELLISLFNICSQRDVF